MITEAEILQAGILVVDDRSANVQLFEQMLADTGYACVTSTRIAEEVLELHRSNHYDLILLDLLMPGMDGFEVMQALGAAALDRYLPVIVLTAEPAHKLRALKAGARDFISRPFDLVEIRTRIRNLLEVRLLYTKLDNYNRVLEQTVLERTAEVRASEERFRRLTELASDWYWEQNETGEFTTISGPVLEMLGLRVTAFFGDQTEQDMHGWNPQERQMLQAMIAAR